jgi:serine protease Do
MRITLILFSLILLLNLGCKRPDRTSQNNNKVEKRTPQNRNEKVLNLNTNRRTESDKNSNPKNTKTSEKSFKGLSTLFQELQSEVFMIYAINNLEEVSQGSGFFIAPRIGITNFHVLEGSKNAVILIGEETYKIEEILDSSSSDKKDFIVFKTDYQTKDPLKISSTRPLIGEDIFAIGSPKGLTNSLTKGTISGFRENHRIQIDATIDHGSSGGPLFNQRGEVIGITTSGVGTGSELNFAVDIQVLNLDRFIKN